MAILIISLAVRPSTLGENFWQAVALQYASLAFRGSESLRDQANARLCTVMDQIVLPDEPPDDTADIPPVALTTQAADSFRPADRRQVLAVVGTAATVWDLENKTKLLDAADVYADRPDHKAAGLVRRSSAGRSR